MNATNRDEGRPLQCPFCDAHRWVTIIAKATRNGARFDWRCSNCGHRWSAVQPVDPNDASAEQRRGQKL